MVSARGSSSGKSFGRSFGGPSYPFYRYRSRKEEADDAVRTAAAVAPGHSEGGHVITLPEDFDELALLREYYMEYMTQKERWNRAASLLAVCGSYKSAKCEFYRNELLADCPPEKRDSLVSHYEAELEARRKVPYDYESSKILDRAFDKRFTAEEKCKSGMRYRQQCIANIGEKNCPEEYFWKMLRHCPGAKEKPDED